MKKRVLIDYLDDIKTILEGYAFYSERAKEDIRYFLVNNLDIIPSLLEAPEYIISAFGEDIIVFLELINDEMIGRPELNLVIETVYEPLANYAAVQRLYDSWYKHLDFKLKLKLSFRSEDIADGQCNKNF